MYLLESVRAGDHGCKTTLMVCGSAERLMEYVATEYVNTGPFVGISTMMYQAIGNNGKCLFNIRSILVLEGTE